MTGVYEATSIKHAPTPPPTSMTTPKDAPTPPPTSLTPPAVPIIEACVQTDISIPPCSCELIVTATHAVDEARVTLAHRARPAAQATAPAQRSQRPDPAAAAQAAAHVPRAASAAAEAAAQPAASAVDVAAAFLAAPAVDPAAAAQARPPWFELREWESSDPNKYQFCLLCRKWMWAGHAETEKHMRKYAWYLEGTDPSDMW